MTPVYKLLYDYSLQITGDQEAAKRITDEAIEAGVRVALRTMNGESGRRVMIVRAAVRIYEWSRERELKRL